MKRLIVAALLIGLAFMAGVVMRARSHRAGGALAREETRQTFELAAGARIEVVGINGAVEIETADTTTAEVYILRTAARQDDLESGRIAVEQTGGSLVVRGENNRRRGFWRRLWGGGSVRQQVRMRVPRRVELAARGVNGQLSVGEIEGTLRVSGINGRVEVAQTTGDAEINGINGKLVLMIKSLSEHGLRVSGVNGSVELNFAQEDVNADLRASGVTGSVHADLPNVVSDSDSDRWNYRARIGTGGALISINGINGSVRLARANAS